jgi:hypothetical protein
MTKTEAAKQLASNPLLPELLDEFKDDIVSVWESANTPAEREQCWQQVHALETVKEHVSTRVRDLVNAGDAGGHEG